MKRRSAPGPAAFVGAAARAALIWTAALIAGACGGGSGAGPDVSDSTRGTPGWSDLAPGASQRVDEVFADLDATTPGCSVGVIRDGELVHARGHGMADLEHGVPLGPDSVFRIGSTSKQFTAAAILLLEQEGKLSLGDDVRRHLPELRDFGTPITLSRLLHHTSGYRDYLTLMRLAGKRDMDWYDDAELMELLARQRDLNFAPGSDFLYSNSGYFLLSQVVPRADDRSLREYADDEIFEPLGMERTHFHDDPTEIVPGRATGYAPAERSAGDEDAEEVDGEHERRANRDVPPRERFVISMTTLPMVGDGGVFTTVRDLARWDRNFYEPLVGGEDLVEALLTPGTLDDGTVLDYAAGLRVDEHRGLRRISHGGSFVGFRAQMVRFPGERTTVICLCNRADGNPSGRAQQVAEIVLEERMGPADAAVEANDAASDPSGGEDGDSDRAVELSAAELRRFTGTFHSDELDVDYRIRLGGDGVLRLGVGHLPEWALEPRAGRVLATDRLRLRFQAGDGGGDGLAGFLLDAGRVQDLRFTRVGG